MTNHYSANFPEPNDPAADPLGKRDPALAFFLAQIAETASQHRSGSIGMTLVLGGQVVRGHLITARQWTNLMEDFLEDAARVDPNGDALLGQLAPALGAWDLEHDELSENRVAVGLSDPASCFIHMKDVTIGVGLSTEGVQTPIWRGLVDSIDGWSIAGA